MECTQVEGRSSACGRRKHVIYQHISARLLGEKQAAQAVLVTPLTLGLTTTREWL